MTAVLARALMALAIHCLGERRRDWALAMQVEFESVSEDGRPLAFAFGCLIAAYRELAVHEEGRLAIAGHSLAFVLVIPAAALLVSTVLADFPTSFLGPQGAHGLDGLLGEQKPLLSEANLAAVPALAVLIGLLAGSQLRLAWLMLERDWTGVAAIAMLMAALTVTLVILTSLVFDHSGSALAQAAALAVELTSISALAWRQGELSQRTQAMAAD